VKIVVASGKGGVGKSMLASSLALLFAESGKRMVAADCDVDAANLGLWLGVEKYEREWEVSTSIKAEIDAEKCTACGKCFEKCKYGAILKKGGKFAVNYLLCEGCGTCRVVCQAGAVSYRNVKNGMLQVNEKDLGFPLVAGKLFPGERCSGKIVAELRKYADSLEHEVMVIDAAAGIGCTVNASLVGADYAVLVTEPTPSGLSDLKRILKVVNHFGIGYGIVLNQWDINPKFAEKIEKFAGESFLGRIPYDKKVVDAIVELKPVVRKGGEAAEAVKEIFEKLRKKFKKS